MDKYKEEQEKKNNKNSDEYTSDDWLLERTKRWNILLKQPKVHQG
jgi:hypothetical protein